MEIYWTIRGAPNMAAGFNVNYHISWVWRPFSPFFAWMGDYYAHPNHLIMFFGCVRHHINYISWPLSRGTKQGRGVYVWARPIFFFWIRFEHARVRLVDLVRRSHSGLSGTGRGSSWKWKLEKLWAAPSGPGLSRRKLHPGRFLTRIGRFWPDRSTDRYSRYCFTIYWPYRRSPYILYGQDL